MFSPDSAVEVETDVRARCEPGAAKTQRRIVSRSTLALGSPLGLVSDVVLCTEAELPLRGTGLLSSLCRAYAECFMLFPTAESGFKRSRFKVSNGSRTSRSNRSNGSKRSTRFNALDPVEARLHERMVLCVR